MMSLIDLRLVIIPIASALIGWTTNYLAIKLLFWPHQAYVVPGTRLKIQGLLSRRQKEIAREVSKVISQDLIPSGKLVEGIDKQQFIDNVSQSMDVFIDDKLDERMKLLPASLRKLSKDIFRQVMRRGLTSSMDTNFEDIANKFAANFDLGGLVEKEIMELDTREVERICFKVAKEEFKFITQLGGILGFIIGVFQITFIYLVY